MFAPTIFSLSPALPFSHPAFPFSKDIFRKMDLREKRLKKIDRRRLFVYNIR